MRKSFLSLISLMVVLSLLLIACGPATPAAAPTQAPQPPPPEKKFLACQVTDVGGIDDKSFNATAWKGVQDAMAKLGIDGQYLESQQQTDYEKNINEFVQKKCDAIITVGFLLGVATAKGAQANPNIPFAIVDYAYPDCFGPDAKPGETCGSDKEISNVLGLTFATDQAAFLAGYVAAAVSKTGKVGTFGGIKIPPVTIFMVGFESGVKYYNEKHGKNVQVLGWSNETQEGTFVGNFESKDDGRRVAESLMQEGADIILPVAGPVGLGSAAAVKERGNAWIIGVDTDWTVSAPEFADVTLTSVMKNMDVAVFDFIKAVKEGTFKGGTYVGTLANNGVGIAPFHQAESAVPAEIKTELEQIKADIIAGKINTGWPLPQK